MISFDQAIAHQAELSLIIAKAVVNLKKVGPGNFSHAILTTRINSLEKNWDEFTEYHRHLCTLRSSQNYQHEYFKTNLYHTTENEYLLASPIIIRVSSLFHHLLRYQEVPTIATFVVKYIDMYLACQLMRVHYRDNFICICVRSFI